MTYKPWSVVKRLLILLGLFSCSQSLCAENTSGEIWVEAESFQSLGGWFVDQQSFDQMGSAYVMAHGIGVPIKDANTSTDRRRNHEICCRVLPCF